MVLIWELEHKPLEKGTFPLQPEEKKDYWHNCKTANERTVRYPLLAERDTLYIVSKNKIDDHRNQ